MFEGFLIGFLFGFVLHKGGLIRYSRIIGTLLLRDLKPMKFMFTGLAVAMLGYGLYRYRPWVAFAVCGLFLMAIGYLMRAR